MIRPRSVAFVLACGLLLALPALRATAAQPTTWRVDPRPIVRVGTADGDTLSELVGITGVVALPGGVTAVSLGRNRRVMLFAATGRMATAVGRRGGGPGEFSGAVAAARWGADSIIVWDGQANRWSVFTAAGTYTRQLSEAEGNANRRRAVDVAPGMLVWAHDARQGVPTWVGPLADSLRRGRLTGDLPTQARVDAQGLLWVRGTTDTTRWSVFAPSGALAATVAVPAGGDVVDVALDRVLVRTTDADGFEFVQSHRLTRTASAATLARTAPLPPRLVTTAVGDTLRVWTRNLVMSQEMGYADRVRYTTDPKQIRFEPPPGYRVHLSQADHRGWSGVIVHTGSGRFCAIGVGYEMTIGWGEGSPICTR
jgi:hypothetical protein